MKLNGLAYLIIAVLFNSLYNIVDKAGIVAGSDPAGFVLIRGFSGIFLAALLFMAVEKKLPTIPLDKSKDLIIIGILGSGISIALRVYGFVTTTAIKANIAQGVIALFTIISSYLFIRERLPKSFLIIFAIMVFGSLFVFTEGKLQIPIEGDILLILSSIILGFNNSYTEKTLGKLSHNTVLFGRTVFGFIFLLLVLVPLKSSFGYIDYPIAIAAGFTFVISLFAYYRVISTFGASTAATFVLLSPAITFIISDFYLGESLTVIQMIGAALVIGGAFALIKIRKIGEGIISD